MNILIAAHVSHASTEHMSLLTVAVGEDHLHLFLAEPFGEPIDTPLTLVFKETEVILSKEPITTTANCAAATIIALKHGEIITQVTLQYGEAILNALVPTLTFDALVMSEGERVFWMVQPSEISLQRTRDGI